MTLYLIFNLATLICTRHHLFLFYLSRLISFSGELQQHSRKRIFLTDQSRNNMVNTRFDISLFFPKEQNDYAGPSIAVWFLILINIVGTVRSLIHILFHDSGAQSIATMNLNVGGSKNIVALLGQWGGGQLIMSIIIWIVLWRYREFVPLMIAEIAIEQLIRIIIGRMKPLVTVHHPPGRLGSFIVLPLAAFMLIISLIRSEP